MLGLQDVQDVLLPPTWSGFMMSVFGRMWHQGVEALGGARFSLTTLLPLAVLAGFIWLLIAAGAYTNHDTSVPDVLRQLGQNPGELVVVAPSVILAGILIRPFQIAIVQLLEGYWSGRVFGLLGEIATERHRRRYDTADVLSETYPEPARSAAFEHVAAAAQRKRRANLIVSQAETVAARYPQPLDGDDRTMPTVLGNVLRKGEDNAGQRYGFDVNAIATRLWPSLSPRWKRQSPDNWT
jgi:hypothetical protein